MGVNLESLTIIISSSYGKEKGLLNKQLVSVKCGSVFFPAVTKISKKSKVNKSIYDNGCIPDALDTKKFSVEPTCPWLFTKSMTLSLLERVEENSLSLPDDTSLNYNPMSNRSLTELPNINNLSHFLKDQLRKSTHICLRVGMKINLKYLTQSFIFVVKDITPSFYEKFDVLPSNLGFKYFEGTDVELIETRELSDNSTHLDFANFGGYKNEIEDLRGNVDKVFAGKRSVSGILISGMSGVGKSLIGKILHSFYKDKCKLLNSEDVISSYKGEAEASLKKIFSKAHARTPCIIFIDDIDEICSGRSQDTVNTGIVNAFLHLMDGVQSYESKEILVIATASQPDRLDQALRRPGRLSHDIVFPVPTEEDRLDILRCLLKEFSSSITEEFLKLVSSKTPGYVASDLMNLISEAFSYTEQEEFPSIDQFLKALNLVKPSSLKNIASNLHKVSLEDISGLHNCKSELLTVFRMSLFHRKLFSASGITCPSRILLFGPSGCGKSMIIHALASQFNLAVIPVKRSKVFGKYFGESEKNLALLFEQAEKASPCLLHFESFDGVAGRKRRDAEVSSDVEGRVINHLKVLLDGVTGFESIFVVAETNRPDLLDKDVIRHGRFHKYLQVNLPSLEDRKDLLRGFISARLESESGWSEISVEHLAEKTEGYSCAEVLLLCKEIASSLEEETSPQDALEEAFEAVSPSTSSKMLDRHRQFSSVYVRK